jgi:hypothetical protein
MKSAAATVGVVAAAATVVYAAWPVSAPVEVDAVVSSAAPVFTPATWKPAAPAPAAPSAPSYDGESGRAVDMRDPRSVTRAVQRHLRRAGCYRGAINGRWTSTTRRAMAAFTERVNAQLPVDAPDPVLLVLLETHADAACTPDAQRSRREETASIAPSDREPGRADPARAETERVERAAPETERVERDAPEPVVREEIVAERPSADARESAAQDEIEARLATSELGTPDAEDTMTGEAAALAAAATARKVAKSDRPRYKRKKYRRGPSFSRSFRKFQRSVGRLFF